MTEWASVTLRQVAPNGIQGGPFGSQLHASDYVAAGVPIIMPKSIGADGFRLNQMDYISEEDATRLSHHRVQLGDLVVGRKGDLGRRVLVSEDQEGWLCGTDCIRIRPDIRVVLPRFLYYCFGLQSVIRFLSSRDSGSTMPSLNTKSLSELPVMLPSMEAQAAILALLGALDDKIMSNERKMVVLFELLQCTWKSAALQVRNRTRFADQARLEKGISYKGEYLGSGDPLVNLANFGVDARFSVSRLKHYRGQSKPRHWVSDGDLVIANTDLTQRREILGQPALVMTGSGRALFTHHVFAVRPLDDEGLDVLWMYGALRDPAFRHRSRTFASGTTVASLPKDAVLDYELPWPDPEARRAWSQMAESLFSSAASASAESVQLAAARDVLLPNLMSGRLRIRDAEKILEDST